MPAPTARCTISYSHMWWLLTTLLGHPLPALAAADALSAPSNSTFQVSLAGFNASIPKDAIISLLLITVSYLTIITVILIATVVHISSNIGKIRDTLAAMESRLDAHFRSLQEASSWELNVKYLLACGMRLWKNIASLDTILTGYVLRTTNVVLHWSRPFLCALDTLVNTVSLSVRRLSHVLVVSPSVFAFRAVKKTLLAGHRLLLTGLRVLRLALACLRSRLAALPALCVLLLVFTLRTFLSAWSLLRTTALRTASLLAYAAALAAYATTLALALYTLPLLGASAARDARVHVAVLAGALVMLWDAASAASIRVGAAIHGGETSSLASRFGRVGGRRCVDV